jgi:hypothetical protein
VNPEDGGYYQDVICYICTQPKELLLKNRVEYYEKLIKGGKRPYAIIYS